MPPEADRERRDWTLPAKQALPRMKKPEEIEEDFVIIRKEKEEVPKKESTKAKVPEPKGDGEAGALSEPTSSFVDMMLSVSARTKTENNANAYSTTFNACLDFFFSVVPNTTTDEVFRFLDLAWAEDPNVALRCIFHLRDVRNGKSDAFKFSDSLYWLYRNHPETLIANLRHVPRTGYWKDLLNFLVRLVVGEKEHQEEVERIRACDLSKTVRKAKQENIEKEWKAVLEKAKEKWENQKKEEGASDFHERPVFFLLYAKDLKKNPDINPLTRKPWSGRALKRRRWIHKTINNIKKGVPPRDKEEIKKEQIARDTVKKQEAAELRHAKRRQQAAKACHVFKKHRKYRAVHIEVARLFAVAMTKDLEKMRKCEANPEDAKKKENFCSLASKWAPSLDNYHDKITHIATTISQILFLDEEGPRQMSAVEVSHLRERYRKEVITPLRKFTKVVESMLGYGLCKEISYKSVPAVSMRRNRPLFKRLDAERFDDYLKNVMEGKSTIAASALKPHHMVREILRSRKPREDEDDNENQVRELQWASYRDRLTKSGKLDRVMPIVDVSGSMAGEPMEVAIALGLLCAEVSKPPFNKLVCTFSSTPELFKVDQPTLWDKVHAMKDMRWGMNTDFEAVFDLILNQALATKLPPEEMISLLIVFSDMQFDQARGASGYSCFSGLISDEGGSIKKDWTSLHDHIAAKFKKHGYTLPTIVYWNLRASISAIPATGDQKGVALVSGFSGQMLKLFMDGDLDFTPLSVMAKALQRYHFLKVVD